MKGCLSYIWMLTLFLNINTIFLLAGETSLFLNFKKILIFFSVCVFISPLFLFDQHTPLYLSLITEYLSKAWLPVFCLNSYPNIFLYLSFSTKGAHQNELRRLLKQIPKPHTLVRFVFRRSGLKTSLSLFNNAHRLLWLPPRVCFIPFLASTPPLSTLLIN